MGEALAEVAGTVVVALDTEGIIGDAGLQRGAAARGYRAEIARVKELPAFEAGEPGFAPAFAVGAAEGAKPDSAALPRLTVPNTSLVLLHSNIGCFD
jgi:hypothetical protein